MWRLASAVLAAVTPLARGDSYSYEYNSAPTHVPTTETAAPTRSDTYAPTRMTEAPSYAPTTETYAPTFSGCPPLGYLPLGHCPADATNLRMCSKAGLAPGDLCVSSDEACRDTPPTGCPAAFGARRLRGPDEDDAAEACRRGGSCVVARVLKTHGQDPFKPTAPPTTAPPICPATVITAGVDIQIVQEEPDTTITDDEHTVAAGAQALLKFDLSDLAGCGDVVVSAELSLCSTSESDGVVSGTKMLYDWQASDTWSSLGGGCAGVSDNVAQTASFEFSPRDLSRTTVDVTADVRAWHAAKGGSDPKAASPKPRRRHAPKATDPRPRRRLGDALDMGKLRALADEGKFGTNILFKLDADSADSKTMDKLAAKVAAAIEGQGPAEHVIRIGGKHEERQRAAGLDLWYKVSVSSDADRVVASNKTLSALEKFLDRTDAHGGVLEVEPDQRLQALWDPDDPSYPDQTHYDAINLASAWDLAKGNSEIVVQVVDTGLDFDHEDLQTNIWQNPDEICDNGLDDDGNGHVDDCYGWDHVNDDNDPQDDDSHGTHCAGTIAADNNNGIGVAGIAGGDGTAGSGVKLMTNKFLGPEGGYTSNAILAIQYGAENGAHISSNSWGGGSYSAALQDAITYFNDQGGIFIAAAGNSYSDDIVYPSCYNNVVSVAALDDAGVKAGFSTYGYCVDVSAPGVDVLSTTLGDGYDRFDGTSMACPHVAGVLALGLSFLPTASSDELLTCAYSTATNVDALNPDYVGKLGAGMIDAFAFLDCLGTAAPTLTPAPSTAAPSSVPTTTPAPTASCVCDQTLVVNVYTDYWPGETTWTMAMDEDAPEICVDGSTAGGPYSSDFTLYTQAITVCVGQIYTFEIFDSYGDGICCYAGEGWYSLELEGVEIKRGGDYGSGESHEFVVPLTPAPTLTPTTTFAPTASCVCDQTLVVDVYTDEFPNEITWVLTMDRSAPGDCVDGSTAGGPYAGAFTRYAQAITVCAGKAYTFEIFDSWGDGICCGYGEGWYSLELNGVEITRGGDYGSGESHAFVVPLTPAPTLAPSPRPTLAPPHDGSINSGWCLRASSEDAYAYRTLNQNDGCRPTLTVAFDDTPPACTAAVTLSSRGQQQGDPHEGTWDVLPATCGPIVDVPNPAPFQDDASGPYWAAWSCDGYDVANGYMEVDLGDSYALFSARVYTGGFRTAVDGYCQHADGARHTIREGGPLPNACAGASKVRVECGGLCGWCYFKSLRVTTIIH